MMTLAHVESDKTEAPPYAFSTRTYIGVWHTRKLRAPGWQAWRLHEQASAFHRPHEPHLEVRRICRSDQGGLCQIGVV
jgi:hypothetical protein